MNVSSALSDQVHREPAECEVRVDGSDIGDYGFYALLQEVSVEASREEAASATLKLETRRNERGRWDVQDQQVFEPWARVEIKVRFGTSGETLFSGYVRETQCDYPEDEGAAVVTVNCQDDSFRLDREHRRRTWGTEQLPVSDLQILSEILRRYGMVLTPDSAGGRSHRVNVHQDDTDIKFLKKLAEETGHELIFGVDNQVYFGPMRFQAPPQPTLMVYAGSSSNCLSFKVREDAHQPDSVAFDLPASRDASSRRVEIRPDLPLLGKVHAMSRNRGLEPMQWLMGGGAGNDVDEADLRAKAQRKANDADIHKIVAEGEVDGTLYGHVLRVGRPVGVDGAGERHSGIYYVDKVSHRIDQTDYRQIFTLLRNAWGDNLPSGII